MNIKKRNRLIEHARKLVETRNNAKWEICKIALEVCEVQLGGHGHEELYTITNFAEEIGMNRKTLSCWMLDYEFAKGNFDLSEPLDDKETKRLNSAISKARMEVTGSHGTLATDNDKILNCVQKHLNESDELWKIRRFIKNIKHHTNFFENLTRKITKEESQYLLEYKELVKTLNRFLKGF